MRLEKAVKFLTDNGFKCRDNVRTVNKANWIYLTEYFNPIKKLTVEIIYELKKDYQINEVKSFNVIGVKNRKFNGISVVNFPRLYRNKEFDYMGV